MSKFTKIVGQAFINYCFIHVLLRNIWLHFRSPILSPDHIVDQYYPIIILILMVFLLFIYTILCLVIERQTILIMMAILMLLYLHAFLCSNISYSAYQSIYDNFSQGNGLWMGYEQYKRENYHMSIIKEMTDPEKIGSIIQLNNGIYGFHGWVANHLLFYGLLNISFRSVGMYGLVILMILLTLSYRSKAYERYMLLIGIILLLVSIACLMFSDILVYMIQNNKSVCEQQQFGTGFKMVINEATVSKIQEVDSIYRDICFRLDHYRALTTANDQYVNSNMMGLLFFGCIYLLGYPSISILMINRDWVCPKYKLWKKRSSYESLQQL